MSLQTCGVMNCPLTETVLKLNQRAYKIPRLFDYECSECEHVVNAKDRYCPHCGTKFEEKK